MLTYVFLIKKSGGKKITRHFHHAARHSRLEEDRIERTEWKEVVSQPTWGSKAKEGKEEEEESYYCIITL